MVARLVLAVALLVTVCSAQDARLLVSKTILNEYLVAGKEITVKYSIFNVGESAAMEVSLHDDGFQKSSYDIVSGSTKAEWERIAPETNVSHIVVVVPLTAGSYNLSYAQVAYKANAETNDFQHGYTSQVGEIYVAQRRDFDRLFSLHLADWLIFCAMTMTTLAIPYSLYNQSRKKYEQQDLAAAAQKKAKSL